MVTCVLCGAASGLVSPCRCTSIHGADDAVQPLTADDIRHIKESVVSTMASHALRTIGLAYRDFPASPPSSGGASIALVEPNWEEEEEIVSQLTFLGVVGIQDPVRPEVSQETWLLQMSVVCYEWQVTEYQYIYDFVEVSVLRGMVMMSSCVCLCVSVFLAGAWVHPAVSGGWDRGPHGDWGQCGDCSCHCHQVRHPQCQ